ncbi:MAG: CDP-alcohol phosphatidyltransferase family protein [Planctomycetota bacterium]
MRVSPVSADPTTADGLAGRGGLRAAVWGLTLGNLGCGLMAAWVLAFASEGGLAGALERAAVWMLAGVVLDMADGPLARRWGVASEAGRRMDAVADWATFGVAPALAAWRVGGGLAGGLGLVFLGAMVARLCRGGAVPSPSPGSGFRGLPTPAAAGLALGGAGLQLLTSWPTAWVLLGLAAVLMLSPGVRFPRWDRAGAMGVLRVGGAALALVIVTTLLWRIWGLAVAAGALAAVYVAGGRLEGHPGAAETGPT